MDLIESGQFDVNETESDEEEQFEDDAECVWRRSTSVWDILCNAFY